MAICKPKHGHSIIKGLVKVHKKDIPIRPTANYRSAPSYRVAKMFSEKLNNVYSTPIHIERPKLSSVNERTVSHPVRPYFEAGFN